MKKIIGLVLIVMSFVVFSGSSFSATQKTKNYKKPRGFFVGVSPIGSSDITIKYKPSTGNPFDSGSSKTHSPDNLSIYLGLVTNSYIKIAAAYTKYDINFNTVEEDDYTAHSLDFSADKYFNIAGAPARLRPFGGAHLTYFRFSRGDDDFELSDIALGAQAGVDYYVSKQLFFTAEYAISFFNNPIAYEHTDNSGNITGKTEAQVERTGLYFKANYLF